jgi:hypothetical protein
MFLGDAAEAAAEGPTASALPVPRWLLAVVLGGVSALWCVGAAGLLLGVTGHYHPLLALAIGAGLAAVLTHVLRPAFGLLDRSSSFGSAHSPSGRSAARWAAAAIVLAGASVAVNSTSGAEHVLHDRDPSVYVTTARWLDEHGDLTYRAPEPFVKAPGLVLASAGVMGDPGATTFDFQFSHFVPALLATVAAIGGTDVMFGFTAAVGGLGLLTIYCFGILLTRRPWLALAVTAAFAVSLPFVAHTRDVYSEPYTLVFLWASLLLLERGINSRDLRLTVWSGLLLSGCLIGRIDGLIYVVGAFAAFGWLLLAAPSHEVLAVRRQAVVFGLAIVPGAMLALADIGLRSPGYARLVRGQLLALAAALLVVLVAIVVITVLRVRRRHDTGRPFGAAPAVAWAMALATAAVLTALWLVPLSVLRASTAGFNGLAGWVTGAFSAPEPLGFPADAAVYWRALLWISWYVGPVVIATAIAGAAVLVRRTVSGGATIAESMLAVVFSTSGLVYLVRPSISPDQVWATRRFLPFVLPCLLLFAGVTMSVVARAAKARVPALPSWIVPAALSVLLVGPGVAVTAKVTDLSDQAGYLAGLRRLCQELGPDGAALVVQDRYWDSTYLQPITAWCGAPAAGIAPDASPDEIRDLATAWAAAGRRLYLVASVDTDPSPTPLEPLVRSGVAGPPVRTPLTVNDRVLAHTFGRAPDTLWRGAIAWDVAPVLPAAG